MSELPWVRFFPSDWLAGTRGMSASETGIYITLIASMYERGEPVPEDHKRLARLCGASNSAFKSAVETLIDEGKIQRVDGGLWNERVQKESDFREEKSHVGRQAANARWRQKDNKNNAPGDADALQTQSDRNANQKPEAIEKDKPSVSPKKSSPFDELCAVLDPDRARAVVDHRQRLRKALTPYAAKLLAKRLAEWGDAAQAADTMISSGWQSFEADWMERKGIKRPAPSPASTEAGYVALPIDHPDVQAVARMTGRRFVPGQTGKVTLSLADIERAKLPPQLELHAAEKAG